MKAPETGYRVCNGVFALQQEEVLRDYGKLLFDLSYGLPTPDLVRLGYQCAVHYKFNLSRIGVKLKWLAQTG
jgi:hypothetical protein